eukprot:TRINITY_DN1734_c1_g1_i1.p1 TRINITY_DN1734_c1_g1~~TRINITY_DN1734_c1_g1_i1.p1  ORF type:complete len:1213 (+),score=404.41 TRINITY_DN1734_c1_g1_i1:63-3641(+)
MSSEQLAQLAAAHAAATGQQTPNAERARATQYIEETKAALGPQGVPVGFSFVSAAGADAQAVQFGLHLVEGAVLRYWTGLPDADRLAARQQAMAVLGGLSLSVPAYVREKAAQIVAEIAKRDWPEGWQTYLQDMVGLCSGGPAPAESALRSLRRLIEDVAAGGERAADHQRYQRQSSQGALGQSVWEGDRALPAARRRALVDALRCSAAGICSLLSGCVDDAVRQPSADALRRRTLAVQVATPLTELCGSAVVMSSGLAATLAQPAPEDRDLRIAQYECICELLSHPLPSGPEGAAAGPCFVGLFGSVCAAVSQLTAAQPGRVNPDDPAATGCHEELHRATAAVVAAIQHCPAARAIPTPGGCVASSALQVLVGTLQVGCLCLATEVLPTVHAILTDDSIPTAAVSECVAGLPEALRGLLAAGVSAPAYDESDDDGSSSDGEGSPFPAASYSELHYTRAEWRSALDDARRTGRRAMIAFTHLARQHVLQVTSDWVAEVLSRFAQPQAGDPRTAEGCASRVCRQAVAWESAEFVVSAAMQYFMSLSVEQLGGILAQPAGASVEGAVRALLAYMPSDPTIVPHYCGLLCAYAPCLRLSAPLLGEVLQRVFKLMEFTREVEAGSSTLTRGTRRARLRVQRCFVKMAGAMPQLLLPVADELVSAASWLVAQRRLADSELALLFEGLVTVSNHMQPAQQAALLTTIVTPTVAEWTNPQNASVQAIGSPQGLLAAVGVLPGGGDDASLRSLRASALGVLSILVGVLRNARPAAAPVTIHNGEAVGAASVIDSIAPQVVPQALQALRALDSLWGEARSLVPAPFAAVLTDTSVQPGGDGGWETAPDAEEQRRREVCEVGDAFFRDLRELCLELLGCVAGSCSLLHEHWEDWVRPGLLSSTAGLELRHLRPLLLHFASSFIFSAPEEHSAAAASFCVGLHLMLADKLTAAFRVLDAESAAAGVEVALAREAGQLARMAFATQQRLGRTLGGGGRRQARLEAMIRMQLLQDTRVAAALLLLDSRALGWSDPGAACVALSSARKLLSGWLQQASLTGCLCLLFGACVQRLLGMRVRVTDECAVAGKFSADSKQGELTQECIASLTDLYFAARGSQAAATLRQMLGAALSAEQLASLDAAMEEEAQESGRQAAMRKVVVAAVLGRNCSQHASAVTVQLPQHEARARSDRCWFDSANVSAPRLV